MARRGRKRRLETESEYWRLVQAGVGTVEACREVGVGRKTGYRWRAENGGLVLPQPAVELSPPIGGAQLVMLPTWLWIEPAWWTARSASASVPGVTVTAVASPVR